MFVAIQDSRKVTNQFREIFERMYMGKDAVEFAWSAFSYLDILT